MTAAKSAPHLQGKFPFIVVDDGTGPAPEGAIPFQVFYIANFLFLKIKKEFPISININIKFSLQGSCHKRKDITTTAIKWKS